MRVPDAHTDIVPYHQPGEFWAASGTTKSVPKVKLLATRRAAGSGQTGPTRVPAFILGFRVTHGVVPSSSPGFRARNAAADLNFEPRLGWSGDGGVREIVRCPIPEDAPHASRDRIPKKSRG